MIGDLILDIKRWLKQHFCIHKYNTVYRKDNGNTFRECIKCSNINDI